jgi:hypothetical protein
MALLTGIALPKSLQDTYDAGSRLGEAGCPYQSHVEIRQKTKRLKLINDELFSNFAFKFLLAPVHQGWQVILARRGPST